MSDQVTESAPVVDKEAEKAAKAAAREAAKAEKARLAAEAKAAKAAEREAAKAKRAEEAAAAKSAKEAERAAAKAKRDEERAAAQQAREAARQPEQNGIRRPKPDTLCGKAWAIFDSISAANGAPASIGESMTQAKAQGLNESNVRAEYARWRKYHGVSGRIAAPQPAAQPEAAAA
jgi:membrane protein involved in colicin uptake